MRIFISKHKHTVDECLIDLSILVWAFCFLGGSTIAQAAEATLALCPKPVQGARYSVILPQADGATLHLVVAPSDALLEGMACKGVPLDLPLDEITWLGAMSAAGLDDSARIVLTVREPAQQIVTLEVDRALPAFAIRRLVPRAEILPFTKYRVFGSEERVAAQPDVTAFDLSCRPGMEPAGVVFDLGTASPQAALAIDLTMKASAGFHAQVVGRGQKVTGDGEAVPSAGGEAATLALLVPNEADVTLVVTCPFTEGRLRLERGTAIAAARRALDRPSAWVWEPDTWRVHPAELLAVATKLNIGKVYITVPIDRDHVIEPGRLARFVIEAHAAGVNVVAVEGDPDMIFGEGRASALVRARALAAFEEGATPDARLDGVQYDIEPYFGAAFWARSEVAWQRWAETLQQLSAALGERVEVVAPYWIMESRGASAALEQAAPALSRITIMAYRTDPAAIVAAAEPLLTWAAAHGLPATVGLESGKLAQENRKLYVKAPEGDLHVIRFDDLAAVVLLDRLRASSTGRSYRPSHVVPGNSARISFNNDTSTMLRVANAVSLDLAAWPSVDSLAYHGLPEVTSMAIAALAETGQPRP